jgi:hypothetical protein
MNSAYDTLSRPDSGGEANPEPVSIATYIRVLKRYVPVIALVLVSAAILYLIAAVIAYLLAPSTRITSVPFRLEFSGAAEGLYPNGLRFSPSEIVASPILLHVYSANNLKRYIDYETFSRSLVVLEANQEYENLVNEYRVKFADPKLYPADRERLEREFNARVESISKHSYSLQYLHHEGKRMPETIVRKALIDTVNHWSHVAVNEQHVLGAGPTVLPTAIVEDPSLREGNLITGIHILRLRAAQILGNVRRLGSLPGANLARTGDDRSVEEIAMRLEEMIRFRIEPLVGSVQRSDVDDPAATVQFVRTQLEYDTRQLKAAREYAESVRQTLAVYSGGEQRSAVSPSMPLVPSADRRPGSGSETVMPQLSDSFLDRLVALASESEDIKFRQQLAHQYQNALQTAIPLEEAVAYHEQTMAQLQSPGGRGSGDAQSLRAEIAAIQNDLRELIVTARELHTVISRNLHPTARLLTITAPPVASVQRATSIRKLALFGILVMLIVLPLSVVGALLHNRMREEDEDQGRDVAKQRVEPATA